MSADSTAGPWLVPYIDAYISPLGRGLILWCLAVLALTTLAALAASIVGRVRCGDGIKLWGLELLPSPESKEVGRLQQERSRAVLDAQAAADDSRQKHMLIKLMVDVCFEIELALSEPVPDDAGRILSSAMDAIVSALPAIMVKRRGDFNRAAMLAPDPEDADQLMIVKAHGFSPKSVSSVRLRIDDSVAGYVLRKQVCVRIDRVAEDPRYKKTRQIIPYSSLLSTPIGDDGVLCIDGQRPGTFTEDDEFYAQAMASALTTLLYLEDRIRLMGTIVPAAKSQEEADVPEER